MQTIYIKARIHIGFEKQFPNGNLNFRSLCALPFGGLGLLASFHSFAMHFLAPCQDQESATIAGCQFLIIFGFFMRWTLYVFEKFTGPLLGSLKFNTYMVSHQITLTYYKGPLFFIKQCYKRETLTHFLFIAAVFYKIT